MNVAVILKFVQVDTIFTEFLTNLLIKIFISRQSKLEGVAYPRVVTPQDQDRAFSTSSEWFYCGPHRCVKAWEVSSGIRKQLETLIWQLKYFPRRHECRSTQWYGRVF